MAKPYRWGGITPEPVKELQKRRRWRASELFARVKQGRAREFDAEPSLGLLSKAGIATAENQSPYPGGTRR